MDEDKVKLKSSSTSSSVSTTGESKNRSDTSTFGTTQKVVNPNLESDYNAYFNSNPILKGLETDGYAKTFRDTYGDPKDTYDAELGKVRQDNKRRQTYAALSGILGTLADTAVAFGGGNVYERNNDWFDRAQAYDLNREQKAESNYMAQMKALNDAMDKDRAMRNDLVKDFMKNMGYITTTNKSSATDTTIGERTTKTRTNKSGTNEQQNRSVGTAYWYKGKPGAQLIVHSDKMETTDYAGRKTVNYGPVAYQIKKGVDPNVVRNETLMEFNKLLNNDTFCEKNKRYLNGLAVKLGLNATTDSRELLRKIIRPYIDSYKDIDMNLEGQNKVMMNEQNTASVMNLYALLLGYVPLYDVVGDEKGVRYVQYQTTDTSGNKFSPYTILHNFSELRDRYFDKEIIDE